jgi:hypothetical protein
VTYRIVPRTEIGLPAEVRGSTGALRPPLHDEPMLTAHYTGVSSRSYTTADVAREVVRIQEIFYTTKPFEYNYVIGQAEDDKIYEFAGKFQAAHSAGENSIAFGVLLLNGVNDPVTPTQIRKFQWLRDVLIADGSLQAVVDQRRHKDMPGASTQCAGIHVDAVWSQMLQPYQSPTQEKPMTFPKCIRLEGQVGAYAQWQGHKVWLPTPEVRDAFCFAYGISPTQIASKAMFVAAGPVMGPRPSGTDDWGVVQ